MARSHDLLRVGSQEVDFSDARRWVADYLHGTTGVYAYPYYDGLLTNDDPNAICEADLLATTLLNASLAIRSFKELKERVREIEQPLRNIPVDADIADSQADLALLDPLFAVLDNNRLWGVGATKLSKVLHRKRPKFIPLYDRYLRECYEKGKSPPVPRRRGRTNAQFIVEFSTAVRYDILNAVKAWNDLCRLASEPPITPLRALDIVAWNQGRALFEAEKAASSARRSSAKRP